MARLRYSTDLTDKEWHVIEPLLPQATKPGRTRKHARCLYLPLIQPSPGGDFAQEVGFVAPSL